MPRSGWVFFSFNLNPFPNFKNSLDGRKEKETRRNSLPLRCL